MPQQRDSADFLNSYRQVCFALGLGSSFAWLEAPRNLQCHASLSLLLDQWSRYQARTTTSSRRCHSPVVSNVSQFDVLAAGAVAEFDRPAESPEGTAQSALASAQLGSISQPGPVNMSGDSVGDSALGNPDPQPGPLGPGHHPSLGVRPQFSDHPQTQNNYNASTTSISQCSSSSTDLITDQPHLIGK